MAYSCNWCIRLQNDAEEDIAICAIGRLLSPLVAKVVAFVVPSPTRPVDYEVEHE